MEIDFDKEIDSLLRNHPKTARKRGVMADAVPDFARRDADESRRAATVHLDVDELSAYAENALPTATRARYISHLADCEMCRKHATSIAMAADVAGVLERSGSPERTPADANATPSNWRAWLASFFSPRALRYALPLLALLVTGTLIFMVTQVRQQSERSVASIVETKDVQRATVKSNEPRDASDDSDNQSVVAAANASPAAINQEAPQTNTATALSKQSGESKKIEPFARSSEDGAAPAGASAASGVASTSVSQPEASEMAALSTLEKRQAQNAVENEAIRVERRDAAPLTAITPTAAPPVKEVAKAADRDEAREKNVEEVSVIGSNKVINAPPSRREQSGGRSDKPAAPEKQNRKAEEVVVNRPSSPKARPEGEASARNRRSVPRTTSDSLSESSVETRSVAGRRFHRQGGGAWLDAEYKSSTSLTNITRGSEQYRALIADEPELRRIAEQLGGEVIVLWKNRAYRIR